MARKRNQKSNRRVQRPMSVVTYDPFGALELSSSHNDSCVVRGRFIQSYSLNSLGITYQNLDPAGLPSDRLNYLAVAFTRYRIKKIVIKLSVTLVNTATYNPVLVYGFYDDSNSISPPTNAAAVVALRCSATTSGSDQDNSDVLTYEPIQKEWNYLQSGADNRFQIPGTLYLANPSGTNVTFLVEYGYVYVFSGSAGHGTDDLHSTDPFRRLLTLQPSANSTTRDNDGSDDPVIVRTPRPPPPIVTGTAHKGYFSR